MCDMRVQCGKGEGAINIQVAQNVFWAFSSMCHVGGGGVAHGVQQKVAQNAFLAFSTSGTCGTWCGHLTSLGLAFDLSPLPQGSSSTDFTIITVNVHPDLLRDSGKSWPSFCNVNCRRSQCNIPRVIEPQTYWQIFCGPTRMAPFAAWPWYFLQVSVRCKPSRPAVLLCRSLYLDV